MWVGRHPVDIASLRALTPAQVARFEATLTTMAQGSQFVLHRVDPNPAQPLWRRHYEFCYGAGFDQVGVRIQFYHSAQALEERMAQAASPGRYRRVQNGNGTQVVLRRVREGRLMGIPTENRFLQTRIQLGDAEILLWEARTQQNVRENASSDFIQFLYRSLAWGG